MPKPTVLVTGAGGQLGSVLVSALAKKHGPENICATDVREIHLPLVRTGILDVTDKDAVSTYIKDNGINRIYHLAAILSARGESNPILTWNINTGGWLNILEASRELKVERLFFPSTIGVFGPTTPKKNTPQDTILQPTTVYGISKQIGENWGLYYFNRYGLDVRSLRYPGLISYDTPPGGGTTDYAIDIFHKAVKGESFTCFLREDTELPMMYMDDAVRATLELMEADKEKLSVRTSYNLSAMSFSPRDLFDAIKNRIPEFSITYEPDFRQSIADSWVNSVNDSRAREDWAWKPEYGMEELVNIMLDNL